MKTFSIPDIAGLHVTVTPAALLGTVLLWVIFAWAGAAVMDFSLGLAVLSGLAAAGLWWLADFCHQLGHAWAARRVGYPMTGVNLGQWLIFSTSQYPADEPDLPAAIHVRRALGGPAASLLISAAVGILAWSLRPLGGLIWWLVLIFCLENLGAGLGAFLPVGFTDGSTLLRLWKQR